MKVLLTGHHGYLGSVMTPFLVAQGHEVTGLDTYYYEGCTLGDEKPPIVPELRVDMRDVTARDLKGFDAVAHLAALCNDPLGDLNANWTYDINHTATIKLAQVARDAGVSRFLYASSCSMYGAASPDEILTEEAPLKPLTPYAISKVRAEEDLLKMADGDFSPVFLRNATAYGASPRLRADIVLNNLVCWAHTTGKVKIASDGTPWRPIVHAEDIARAFAASLVAPRDAIHAQALNVGVASENYQVRDLASIVEKTVPNCSIEYTGQSGPDPRNYRVDFKKITKMLPGFRPAWNATRGAQQIYDAVKSVGLTLDQFQSKRFIRLGQLKYLLDEHLLDDTLRWREAGHRA